jgi:hypothetical protein
MDPQPDDISGVIGAYSAALRRLIARLEAQLDWNAAVALDIERGGSLSEVMALHHSATSSLTMTEQLTEFERARFDMRASVAKSLRSFGMSNPEIAELFGISRQLVHRILADDRELSNS